MTKQLAPAQVSRSLNGLCCLLLALTVISADADAKQGRGRGGTGNIGGRVFGATARFNGPAVPPQFDITGIIQEATLDRAGTICRAADARLAGGTIKVNGIEIIIPCNTILQMPAASLTWQEVFALAPRDIGLPLGADGVPTQTGLAIADKVKLPVATPYNGPLPSYEAHVQGNIVDGRYIAGLVFLSQQNLNLAQGVVTAIDYDNGELQIATKGPRPGLARVRINDPFGRYGLAHGAPGSGAALVEPGFDARFSVDAESPTIHAATGFPMCIPRSNPFTAGDDPECPQANRPRAPACASLPDPFPPFAMAPAGQYCTSFMMPPPSGLNCNAVDGSCPPDATRQVPFQVGDVIDYMGTLKVDSKGAYISAHTITTRLAVYTSPGTMPAYLAIEMLLQGTGAFPVGGLPQESTTRVKVEGFSTDPSALVDIYAIDVDPRSGATSERLLGAASASGPPVIGRFRFIPLAGAFLPPPREFRVVSRTLCNNPFIPCAFSPSASTYANGIVAGQYRAPNFEFIFPENVTPGDPVPPANFQDMAFLFCGSGPLGTPTGGSNAPTVGQLDPPPWGSPMATPFFAPTLCPTARVISALPVVVPPAADPVVVPPAADPVVVPPATDPADVPPATDPVAVPPVVVPPAADPVAVPQAPARPRTAVASPTTTPVAAVTGFVGAATAAPASGAQATAAASASAGATAPESADASPPPADSRPAPVDLLAPTASATATAEAVEANQTVTLSASASDPNTPPRPLTYAWTQLGWPAVAITNATRDTATFTAPAVTTPTTLTFNLAVRSTVPLTTNTTVSVLVKPQAPPPAISFTAPTSAVAGEKITLDGVVAKNATFAWKQTGGAVVTISKADTLKPEFVAPAGPASLSFTLTAKGSNGVSAVATKTIDIAADEVRIGSVSWDNSAGKATLAISATSSAAGPGAVLTALYWNNTLPSSAPGSESHPLSVALTPVLDPPRRQALCGGVATACYSASLEKTLVGAGTAGKAGGFVAPTTVVVKSNGGGRASVSGPRIRLR